MKKVDSLSDNVSRDKEDCNGEESKVQELTLKDFEGIDLGPNALMIDYLAVVAERALDILDHEKNGKKKDEGKRESCVLDHLDEQPTKKKKLEERIRETRNQPRLTKGVCIKEFSNRVISREQQRHSLPNGTCMKECSETVIRRADQSKRNEDSLLSGEETLTRKILVKRSMVGDKTASDHDEFQELKTIKKRKNMNKLDIVHAPDPPPELPREFMETLQKFAEGKSIEELQLVIQKGLFDTDISKSHNRLSLPLRLLLREFLTQDEIAELKLHEGKHVKSIEADIIEPSLEKSKVSLRRWEMKKNSGNSSISYVFSGTWNNLVLRNSLRIGHVVQVWSARVDGKLWFLLVRVPKGRENNPTSTTASVSPPPGNENEAAGPSVSSDPSDEPGPSSSSLEPDQDHRGQD